MAFEAVFTIEDKTFKVVTFNYASGRDHDRMGRPTSQMYGFKIEITVEHSADCILLHEWAYKNHEVKNGKITFMKRDNNSQKQTEIRFSDGYIVNIQTSFLNSGELPMTESFVICPGKIEYESQGKLTSYDMEWPDNAS